MRFQLTLLLMAIGLLGLAACGQPPAPSTSGSSEPSPVSSAVASSPTSASSTISTEAGYPQLLEVVSKTQAAVTANDFAKAQQEFDQFEGNWSQVEDGIKEKSSESYDAIEQDMDQVTTALRSAQADQAKTSLQAMSSHIQSIPPN